MRSWTAIAASFTVLFAISYAFGAECACGPDCAEVPSTCTGQNTDCRAYYLNAGGTGSQTTAFDQTCSHIADDCKGGVPGAGGLDLFIYSYEFCAPCTNLAGCHKYRAVSLGGMKENTGETEPQRSCGGANPTAG